METPFSAGHAMPPTASLWTATTPAQTPSPPLSTTLKADVTVVGAGFMGLAAALELAENGVDVAVIDAAQVGWGASGRNNGLLAPGLKRDPHEVRKILGRDAADRLLRLSGQAPDVVAGLVEKHGIDCDLQRKGWIQAAHARRALPILERRVRAWQELGADTDMIDVADLRTRLGTDFYVAATIDPRGGSLNPLAFVRGLAVAARKAGAQIFEQSPALRIERQDEQWCVSTPNGLLRSEAVLVCTNAYNQNVADLYGSLIPVRTAQIASAPLPTGLSREILPGGESASDTQRLLTSFRLTADKRLITGGASATAGDEHDGLFAHLHRGAKERFPQLGEIAWEFGWSGYLALTDNHLPKIFDVGENYWGASSCNGRGIAMATVSGQMLARLVSKKTPPDCAIPIETPRRITGFSLRRPAVAVSVVLNRFLDVAERRFSGGSSSI
ncbi:MAG: NAD(P)/FAD-dependent oxidoreductase [Woeseiaceae bacterium]